MELKAIWNEFDEMVREMAAQAIKNAVDAIRSEKKLDTEDEGIKAYYRGSRQAAVDVAASVLWKLFSCCAADCIAALNKMAESEIWIYSYKEPVLNAFADEMLIQVGFLKKRTVY